MTLYMSLHHYTAFSIHGKLLFPFSNFQTSKKKTVSAARETYKITMLKKVLKEVTIIRKIT